MCVTSGRIYVVSGFTVLLCPIFSCTACVQLVPKSEVSLLYRNSQNGKIRDNTGPGLMPKSLLLVHILANEVDVRQIIATLSKD